MAVQVDEKPRPQPKATSAGLHAATQVGGDESRAWPYLEDDAVGTGAHPDAMTTAEAVAPKEGAPPTPENVAEADPYEGMTREELLEQAEVRGLDFGSGYVSKPRLLKALRTGDTSE